MARRIFGRKRLFGAAFRAPDMGTAWKDAGPAGGVQLETIGGHWDFGHNRYRLSRSVVFGHKERCREKSGRHQIFERSEAIHARAKIAPDLGFAPCAQK